MYFLVDPIVLCLPEPEATSDQIEYFINHLIAWNEFIDVQGSNDFYITEVCYFALDDANRYPYHDSMVNLIDSRPDLCVNDEDRFASANDVYNACRKIIESASSWPFFESIESLSLPDLLVDYDTMCLDPDLVERIPLAIVESLQETFAYVAYAKKIENNPIVSELLFLTHPIPDSDKIEIDVHLLVDDSDELQHTQTDLPIVGTPEDLLERRNLTDIWEDTRQAIDRAVIIHKKNDPILKDIHLKDIQLSPYTVCPRFNDSLQNCQLPTDPDLLGKCFEKIAQLLLGKTMQNNQHLRTGAGGNNPQQEKKLGKNNWKAWRLRLTGGPGDAYRLHYWLSGDQYILSNVIRRNDNNVTICDIDEEVVKQIK